MKNLLLFIIVLLLVSVALAQDNIFMVTNTGDTGDGSLRQAILDANATPGIDYIHFELSGDRPHTIQPQSALPEITDPVVIDGSTQPGTDCSQSQLMIELDGSQLDSTANGLTLLAAESTIQGLVINRFGRDGIHVRSSPGNNYVACNFIGTDVTGTVALGNGRTGIFVDNSSGNQIGGLNPGEGNLISGNAWDGIAVYGGTSINNVIQGNLIGTDVTGTVAVGNENVGVFIDRAPANIVGGSEAGAGNVISGNHWEGVYIYRPQAHSNVVAGNFIGIDVTGTVALGNRDSGVVISMASNNLIGGHSPEARNVISANGLQGIYISGVNVYQNVVIGNYIGTDAAGQNALGNAGSGVYINNSPNSTIGGEHQARQNLITGNAQYGIYIYGTAPLTDFREFNLMTTDDSHAPAITNGLSDLWFEDPNMGNSA